MDMGQSQLTVKEVQLKIKIIKKLKNPTTGCFPLMGSSGGVEAKQKQNRETPQYISHISPLAGHRRKLRHAKETRASGGGGETWLMY